MAPIIVPIPYEIPDFALQDDPNPQIKDWNQKLIPEIMRLYNLVIIERSSKSCKKKLVGFCIVSVISLGLSGGLLLSSDVATGALLTTLSGYFTVVAIATTISICLSNKNLLNYESQLGSLTNCRRNLKDGRFQAFIKDLPADSNIQDLLTAHLKFQADVTISPRDYIHARREEKEDLNEGV